MIDSKKNYLLIFATLVFFSCNNSSEADQQKKIDSMFPQKNATPTVMNKDSSSDENSPDGKPEKPFRLSPKDSAHVADSVFQSKNGVRDFK